MSVPRWLYDPGTSYGKKLPKLTKMLNTLDGNSKAKLRKQLLEKQKEYEGKGLVSIDEIKKSPIIMHMIESAVEEAERKKSVVLESIEQHIQEEYDGKVEAFVKDRPAALYAIEVNNMNTLASEIFKRAKDAYTEVLNGWPLEVSALQKKNRQALKARYEALALIMSSAAGHIGDDVKLLQHMKERKTIEVAADADGATLLAHIESTINTSVDIISELFECANKIKLAAEKIDKGRPWYKGRKKDQARVPTEAIRAAIHCHNSATKVNTSLGDLTPERKPGLPQFTGQIFKFLKSANRTANLAGRDIILELETQLQSGHVVETNIWWLTSPVPMNINIDAKDIKQTRISNKKGIEQWNTAPPAPAEMKAIYKKLQEDIEGPILMDE